MSKTWSELVFVLSLGTIALLASLISGWTARWPELSPIRLPNREDDL